MARVVIAPATLRDVSYVMGNLRPLDEIEVMCQMPDGAIKHEIAYQLLVGSEAFVALFNDQPVACFGTAPINAVALSVWMLGTRRCWRAANAISRFFVDTIIPDRLAEGYTVMEARSWEKHHVAHSWMVSTGAKRDGEPFIFGKGRQKFLTFRWTDTDFRAIAEASEAA